MAKSLVLLTGGTGFLGYSILVELLKNGYRVRVAARSHTKINQVLAAPTLSSIAPSSDDLSFVIVPDMAAPGAYDDAVQGVQYIIHAASPLPSFGKGEPWPPEELDGAFVTRSKTAALNILDSAQTKEKDGIRRVVMTSSTVAMVPFEVFVAETKERDLLRGPDSRIPIPPPPYMSEIAAYCAGKAAALNSSEDFMKTNDTSFDLVTIIPSWIFGTDELVVDVEGMRAASSNSILTDVLLGNKSETGLAGNAVLCADVARAHVKALDLGIEGNQSFILSSPMEWETAIPIARGYYPEAFAEGFLRDDGKQQTIPLKWDATKAKTVLGLDLAPFEIMVKEVAGQYLKLLNMKSKEEK